MAKISSKISQISELKNSILLQKEELRTLVNENKIELMGLLIAQFPDEKMSKFGQIHCIDTYISILSYSTRTEYKFNNNKWNKI